MWNCVAEIISCKRTLEHPSPGAWTARNTIKMWVDKMIGAENECNFDFVPMQLPIYTEPDITDA